MVDEVTRVLVALTASSSAVAGWLVWTEKGWKHAWMFFAGTASVLSILHVALKVSDRVKDWSDTKGHFVRLRTELETFIYHMKVNPSFPLAEFTDKFNTYRSRFGEGVDRKKFDFLAFGMDGASRDASKYQEALQARTSPS